MKSNNKKYTELVVLLIILVLVIILAVNVIKKVKNGSSNNGDKGTSAVNTADEAYNGMKIQKKGGDIIIEGENNAKTIETTKTKDDSNFKETTASEKEKYVLSNVKVNVASERTIVTGNVTNNDKSKHNLIINVKFYSSDNKLKGANSKKVLVDAGTTEKFSIALMDDMSQYTYKIQVEYAD